MSLVISDAHPDVQSMASAPEKLVSTSVTCLGAFVSGGRNLRFGVWGLGFEVGVWKFEV